ESLCPASPLTQPSQSTPVGQVDSGPITASSSLPTSPPSNAFDENPETLWNAGAGPEQWIQIDLGQPTTISAIRLIISQFPDGETVHQIWGSADANNLILLHEFKGFTQEPGTLEFNPPTLLTEIQFIKVVTTQSPSWVAWREIEIK
ncbi:MAG: discoidin domain-containing protein, partial [Anaerolineae bacterium]|nr:discoidin domain-containing protein [Anaerolineae bacterium]